jgi:hypothetical protein
VKKTVRIRIRPDSTVTETELRAIEIGEDWTLRVDPNARRQGEQGLI